LDAHTHRGITAGYGLAGGGGGDQGVGTVKNRASPSGRDRVTGAPGKKIKRGGETKYCKPKRSKNRVKS